jgi:hypothetical protein
MVRHNCARCFSVQEPAHLSSAAFDPHYRDQTPVVTVNSSTRSGGRFRALTTLEALTEQYG